MRRKQPMASRALGRQAAALADLIRNQIAGRELAPGAFLPSIRELAARHSLNGKTINRALVALKESALLEVVDRHGYRVAAQPDTNNANRHVIAYVPDDKPQLSTWQLTSEVLLNSFRGALNRRHWPLVAIGARGRNVRSIIGELESMHVSGVVINWIPPDWVDAFRHSRMQLIVVDDWPLGSEVDSVAQDGQMGCMLAVEHLARQGCRRIGWFGPKAPSGHSTDRFSGVVAKLQQLNLPLYPTCAARTDEATIEAALSLLAQKDGPDGVVAPWIGHAAALISAAQQLRLPLGKAFHVVSWCPDVALDNHYLARFKDGMAPPAITWSPVTMAEVAIHRLEERFRDPDLPFLRIKLPVKLMFPA